MHITKTRSTNLRPEILLRIYKIIKNNPKRTFIQRELSIGNEAKRYCETLVKLGLLEKVNVIYKFGNNLQSKREIGGYKLKNG